MSVIRAELTEPSKVLLDVTITATLAEWKALQSLIVKYKSDPTVSNDYGSQREPFWTLIHRLGDVISAVEKQHSNYGD